MRLIVGLGNPGRDYANTRHNIGFDVIDLISRQENISMDTAKFKSLIGSGFIGGEKVILMKPQTFMNLSGEAVRMAMDFYKLDPVEDIIVVCDDIYLDPGQLRIRKKGSDGGHNGIKNIILHTGTKDIKRVRIGVGKKPEGRDLANFVLGHFDAVDRKLMDEGADNAYKAIKLILSDDIDKAMNLYNAKKA